MCKKMFSSAVEKDELELIMGSMGRYQCIICFSIFLCKVTVAWHLIAHGIMVPRSTPIYCSNTTKAITDTLTIADLKELLEEACSESCPKIIMSNKYYDNTIVNQFELYCGFRAKLTTLAQMVVMCGVLIGNILFGIISDKWGRKVPFIVASVLVAPLGVLVAFSVNVWMFLIFKFFVNVCVGGAMCTGFVILLEVSGVRWRSPMGVFYHYPFVVGHALLPVFALYFRDWRYFQLCLSVPSIILIYYFWVLPESPRWLLIVGKLEKCVQALTRIAKCNKRPTENIDKIVEQEYAKKKSGAPIKKGRFKDLFASKYLSFLTLTMWANWFVVTMAFYGVGQYVGAIGSNIYIGFAAGAFIQFPGASLVLPFFPLTGPKYTMVTSFLIATIFFIGLIFAHNPILKIVMATIANLGLSMGFVGCYVCSGELFPTVIRNVGIGSSSMCGRMGGIIGALVADIKSPWIPSFIFAMCTGAVVVLDFFLPDTRGIKLPDTIEDATNLRSYIKEQKRKLAQT